MQRRSVVAISMGVGVLALLIAVSGGISHGKRSAQASTSVPPLPTTTGAPVPTTPPPPAVFPLTGIPTSDEAARNLPALIVKIDNTPEARPQFGIDKADIVYEEKVEGGLSRLMAIFQSQNVDQVGPVRSLRSTDIYALRPLGGGLMGFSGGIQPFKDMLPSSNLVDVSADTQGNMYARMPGRPFVHSLYTSTSRLRSVTPANLAAPKPMFQHLLPGEPYTAEGSINISGLGGRMGPSASFDWTWDRERSLWKRGDDGREHDLVNGQITANNVIIQYVPYRQTAYRDPANNPVDEAVFDGTGDSVVLVNGTAVTGRWVRPALDQPTVFNDAAGHAIKLAPGTTWVELVPAGNGVNIVQ